MELANNEPLIIDVPEKLSMLRRTTEASLTLFGAVVWMIALRPIVAIILWYLGWHLAYAHMIKLEGLFNAGYFAVLGGVALSIFVGLLLFSRYNAARFGAATRRRPRGAATLDELAAFFAMDPASLQELREAGAVVVYRTARDRIELKHGKAPRIKARHEPLGEPTAPWSPLRKLY